jgi:hypothetical protein
MRRHMARLFAALLPMLLAACATTAQSPPTARLLVLPVLHGLHASNEAYPYERIYRIVEGFGPAVVGVEIRPEDLGAEDDYLAANYPLEMRELAGRYSAQVAGLDWLGPEIAGRPIPLDWWRSGSPQKALERDLGENGPDLPELEVLQERQLAIARDAGPAELADGRYFAASRAYYDAMAKRLAGTKWAALPAFYAERDRRIAAHAVAAAEGHPGERIVFVVGADHFGPVREALAKRFGEEALAAVPDR